MPHSQRRPSRKSNLTSLIVFVIVTILVVIEVFSSQGNLDSIWGGVEVTESIPTTSSGLENWYGVFFTNPDRPESGSREAPDQILAAAIDQARLSVDIASYDFDLPSLRDALLRAQHRGVTVRMVVDSDNRDEETVQTLILERIPVLGDRREGLMHNKFIIIDRVEVWSGSMNFTINGVYHNNNNLIRIRSSRLAEDYLAEFDEMFVDDQFGPSSPANTPYPRLSINGTNLEVYFSPDDGTAAHLVDLIGSAKESIYFLAYSFTADNLADAMLASAKSGVTVMGVFEDLQYRSNTGTEFDRLRTNGVQVRLDGNPYSMHHKVIIIDQGIVATGSYNFSASAEKSNDENTLILYSPEIASLYLAEFERVYNEAQP